MHETFRMFIGAATLIAAVSLSAQTPGWSSSNGNTTTSDKVGIGTTAPEVSLHVATESTSQRRGLLVQQSSEGPQSAFLVLRKSRGALALPSIVQSGDSLGTIFPEAYDGTSYVRPGANFKFIANGTMATNSIPTDIVLSTGAGPLGSERLRITHAGLVGIGTPSPAATLHVAGNAQFDGTVTGTFIKAHYQDVAEWVPSRNDLAPATVVVLDATIGNAVVASERAYDTTVAGVVSAQPGIILGEEGTSKEQVATTGRVMVKVDASRGPIAIGDLLVTSDRSGYAMRSTPVNIGDVAMHRPGTIIGKALQALPEGEGEILVLLSLQ